VIKSKHDGKYGPARLAVPSREKKEQKALTLEQRLIINSINCANEHLHAALFELQRAQNRLAVVSPELRLHPDDRRKLEQFERHLEEIRKVLLTEIDAECLEALGFPAPKLYV
jgi:hypothetical protein